MQAMRYVVCAAAAMAGACAAEPVVGVAYYQPPGQPDDDPCPVDGCGGNSPVMDGVWFWKLHFATLPGQPNDEGVQITGVHKGATQMRLQVVNGDELAGVHPVSGAVIAMGTSLPGTIINLAVKGQPYEILIEAAAPNESFWSGDPLPIWRYRLKYRPVGMGTMHYQALCADGDSDPTRLEAFVFAGDLYNPDTKAIQVGAVTDGWMNIACADSAIYKMHAVGYTSAAQAKLGIATTVAQRRAMLNAWTSNVCGNGESFTQQGEPIRMRESLGVLTKSPYTKPMSSREAIWSENGAVCLSTHRLHEDDPLIYDLIAKSCGGSPPPPCPLFGNWKLLGDVMTGNP